MNRFTRARPRNFPIVLLCLAALSVGQPALPDHAAANDLPRVTLDVSAAGPRAVEDTLQQSIIRDYANAWQTMDLALAGDDPAFLDQYWIGVAQDKLTQLITDQKRTGLHLSFVDYGHNLQAVFYPPDGAAMLLQDTADLELQVRDQGRIIYRRRTRQEYVALMTPAQDRWLVRVLESVPNH